METDVEAIRELTDEVRKLRLAIEKIWAIPVPYNPPQPQPWAPPVPMPYWQNPVYCAQSQVNEGAAAAARATLYNR